MRYHDRVRIRETGTTQGPVRTGCMNIEEALPASTVERQSRWTSAVTTWHWTCVRGSPCVGVWWTDWRLLGTRVRPRGSWRCRSAGVDLCRDPMA